MTGTCYTHVTIRVDDADETADFYGEVFGLERIPTPDFDETVQWLECGDIQLHMVETEAAAPEFNHHALHVDDIEGVYRALLDHPEAEFEALGDPEEHFDGDVPPVYEMPNGSVQFYFRDPAGNLVEVDYPEADEIDESVVTNLQVRNDVTPRPSGESEPALYGPALLAEIGRGASAADD